MKKKWKNRIKTLFQTKQVYAELGFGIIILNIIYVPLLSSSFHLSLFTSFLGSSTLALFTIMTYYLGEVFLEKESRFDKKKERKKVQHENQGNEKQDDIVYVKESLLSLTRRMQFVIKDEETFEETFGEGLALLQVILEVIKEYQNEKEVLRYIQYDVVQKVDDILSTYEQMNDESKQQANGDLKQLFQRKREELTDCFLKQKEEQLQQTFEKQIKELEESKYEYVYLKE